MGKWQMKTWILIRRWWRKSKWWISPSNQTLSVVCALNFSWELTLCYVSVLLTFYIWWVMSSSPLATTHFFRTLNFSSRTLTTRKLTRPTRKSLSNCLNYYLISIFKLMNKLSSTMLSQVLPLFSSSMCSGFFQVCKRPVKWELQLREWCL